MIHHGDLFDVLPTLAEASIDACVTDPPYGIGFMGKQWDMFRPGVEAKRIVPNRAIDSENPNLKGRTRGPASSPSAVEYDRSVRGQREFQAWTELWARDVLRVLKPGAHIVVCGAPRSYHRMASGLEDAGFVVRDGLSWLYGQGFPKSLNLGDGRGTALKPAWEPIVLAWKPFKGSIKGNVAQYGTGALNIDACRIGFLSEADKASAFPGGKVTDKGSGKLSGPAGAYGASDRVEREATQSDLGRWPGNAMLDEEAAAMLDEQSGERPSAGEYKDPYPKNARIIHAATFKEGWAQFTGGYWAKIVTPEETYPVRPDGSLCEPVRHGDRVPRTALDLSMNRNNYYANETGGASRFYYVAKPSREERDYGCQHLEQKPAGSLKSGDGGWAHEEERGRKPRHLEQLAARNFHPTVKPIELMRWLVKLITPIGGTVLDPFTGSGTTGMACRYELRDFIGIEREAEYVQIATARIAAVAPLFSETA